MGNKRSQKTPGQHSSPVVFPVKKSKTKSSKQNDVNAISDDSAKTRASSEHRIDIGDENSDLLGYNVFSGKLSLVKKFKNISKAQQDGMKSSNLDATDAKLSSKALVWNSLTLYLEDIISVSYSSGLRHFTLHTYVCKKSWLSCIVKPQKCLKDFCFLASSPPEAIKWVSGFAELQCFVKCLPHPMTSSKTQSSELLPSIPLYDEPIKCKSPPRVLVILNPRSGHGRSSKVYHGKVEPIFKLAGFEMEVVKTTSAGHAKKLASTVDYSSCPDGIICVGGDGIVNEVLNGLLVRDNQKEPFSIPIGIIPAGSDNSLVWTILGVRDPVSAAMTIVKGGFTPTDVFAVEWIQNGIIHYGTTVSYYGFLSDVLELSEKYQKRFGPLRYFVAGFLKFLCLPQFSFDLEYLPASTNISNDIKLENRSKTDMSDLFAEVLGRSGREGLPRASSLSTIDSVMTPSRMSGDLDTTTSALPSNEPSEFVRCLDPKSKRLSSTRSNLIQEPEEVIRPQISLSSTPNYPRTRSKSRGDKGLTGLSINTTSDSRLSWANDKEEISSTISDPGPIWDYEPKWDPEAHWDESENPIEFQGPPDDIEQGVVSEFVPNLDEKWVVKKGTFLGVLVCNHSCKTVQSLSSQVVAPKAVHDDNTLDLLMVKGSGRFRLLRFFILLQFGRHLSLPYVEYVKVKSVKLKATKNNQNGCGIDGELIKNNGQVICYLLPEQCRLIGRCAKNST